MAERVYSTPLLDKLGVQPGIRVAIVGHIDPAFAATLAERTHDVTFGPPLEGTDLILLAADSLEELAVLRRLRDRIRRGGAIWVVSRKGRKATIRDVDIIAAARSVDLVDNKVASFSDTHTALRLVIRGRFGPSMVDVPMRLAAVVLAAGAGRRFGGHKLAALLHGRPVLQHVLDTLDQVHPVRTVVVVGPDTSALQGIHWHDAERAVNQEPHQGLSSSLRLGLDACATDVRIDGVFILLGDQPLTALSTLRALAAAAPAAVSGGALAVLPDYAEGGGANPILLLRAGFGLASQAAGDRGLASVLAGHPDQLHRVWLPGSNPDVDTLADLEMLEGRR